MMMYLDLQTEQDKAAPHIGTYLHVFAFMLIHVESPGPVSVSYYIATFGEQAHLHVQQAVGLRV